MKEQRPLREGKILEANAQGSIPSSGKLKETTSGSVEEWIRDVGCTNTWTEITISYSW